MADTSTPSSTVPYGDDDEEYEEDDDVDEEYRQPDDEYRQLDVFLEHFHRVSACFLATLDSVRMEPTRKRRFRHVRRVPSVALPTRQYWSSVWGRMLMEMAHSSPNCSTSKLFRRRFRVPYIIFQSIVELVRQQEWYHDEQFDVCKQPLPPLELLLLGVLRILGRGLTFDDVAECNGISASANRVFFHKFCKHMAQEYNKHIFPPGTDDEIKHTTEEYRRLGFPGCVGSCDCVHIPWDKAPASDIAWYRGKEKYPTLAYQVTVDHKGLAMSVTNGFPGTVNDKTIARYDDFLQSIHARGRYADQEYDLYTGDGLQRRHKGLWLMVDQGYHRWKVLQCPLAMTTDPAKLQWSQALESCRKDVECFFGRLKGRFRCLKLPCNFKYKVEIDNMFFTCVILQNIIQRHDYCIAEMDDDFTGAAGLFDHEDVGLHIRGNLDAQGDIRIQSDTDFSHMRDASSRLQTHLVSRCMSTQNRRPIYEVPDDLTISLEDGWYDLQHALIVHYTEACRLGMVARRE